MPLNHSLQKAVAGTLRDLNAARRGFEEQTDGDLIAYFLYEMNALGAKHGYLLRLLSREATP